MRNEARKLSADSEQVPELGNVEVGDFSKSVSETRLNLIITEPLNQVQEWHHKGLLFKWFLIGGGVMALILILGS